MPLGPALIALAGLPGAGKTTLARNAQTLAQREGIDVRVLSRDEVRAALFAPCDWTEDEKLVAFEAMLGGAVHHLERNRWVILEGMPFTRRSEAEAVRIVAREFGASALVVHCHVTIEVAQARIDNDRAAGTPHAGRELDDDLVASVAARSEELDPDLVLDMTQPLETTTALLLQELQRVTTLE
ncbi:MAG: AAA family ATPase [Acidimicrobiia bacterium]